MPGTSACAWVGAARIYCPLSFSSRAGDATPAPRREDELAAARAGAIRDLWPEFVTIRVLRFHLSGGWADRQRRDRTILAVAAMVA